jgi:hypothetical protein
MRSPLLVLLLILLACSGCTSGVRTPFSADKPVIQSDDLPGGRGE